MIIVETTFVLEGLHPVCMGPQVVSYGEEVGRVSCLPSHKTLTIVVVFFHLRPKYIELRLLLSNRMVPTQARRRLNPQLMQ